MCNEKKRSRNEEERKKDKQTTRKEEETISQSADGGFEVKVVPGPRAIG